MKFYNLKRSFHVSSKKKDKGMYVKLMVIGDPVFKTLTTDKPFGPIHGDGPHHVLPQMLRDLQNQADRVVEHLESHQDWRQPLIKPDVHNGADHLAHATYHASIDALVGDLAAGATDGLRG